MHKVRPRLQLAFIPLGQFGENALPRFGQCRYDSIHSAQTAHETIKNGNSVSSKLRYLLGAAACCSLLASCGGGNNTPDPTPTETPTPTPTETPTPADVTFDFTEEFEVSTVRMYIYAYFTPGTGGDEVFSDGRIINDLGAVAFELDPEAVLYRFVTTEDILEFLGTDRVSVSPTERVYENASGRLIMETPFENLLRVQLEKTDPFIRETIPGELRSRRVLLFVKPVETEEAIDTTLAYTGDAEIAGGTSGTTTFDSITQPSPTFTVTPGTAGPELTGSVPVVVDIGGTPTTVATLDFEATLAATGAFAGTAEDAASGFSGQIVGTLAGPDREEMVILFRVVHDDGRKFLGSFLGQQTAVVP